MERLHRDRSAELRPVAPELFNCLGSRRMRPGKPLEDDPDNHLQFNKGELKNGKIKALSQKIVSPDEVVLTVSRQSDQSGKGIAVPLTLRNVNGEWKIVVFNVRDAEGKVTNLYVFGTRPPSP